MLMLSKQGPSMKNGILLVTSSLHATVSSGQKVDQRWSLEGSS